MSVPSAAGLLLGVNIDHVATLRQARRATYPDPLHAALQAEQSGADSITLHLREDRRHIQDHDVERMAAALQTRMNLEMAATGEMVAIARRIRPADVCLVPEKRTEVTTEGGLDVAGQEASLREVLGERFIDVYSAIKELEHQEFMTVISPWEREHLLLHV